MLDNRTSCARALLAEHGLDALVITSASNLRYLCGFTGSDGVLVITAQHSGFLTDSRYTSQATSEVSADSCREYAVKLDGILAFLDECGIKRIGFESEHLTCATLDRLRAKSQGQYEWVGLDRPLMVLRGIKDAAELAQLRAAASLAGEAFEEIVPLIRPGTSEREIAVALEFAMRRRGGDEKSFDSIVASGERGALPHGRASTKLIAAGELVTIDFGVLLDGYCSDETVTLAVGVIDDELHRIYETVLRAQRQAIAAVQPGASLKEIDAVAREVITAKGYGAFFGHGLGHGVGLEVHEYPTLSPRSADFAQVGMVFTIEPGIYIPGRGGVRIEDMVVVTEDGCQLLTSIPKWLRQLPN